MSPNRMFTAYGVIATAVTLLLVFTPVAFCQTVQDEDPEPAQADTIEEVMVYGTSLGRLQVKVFKAEEKLFDIFNSFNSDDDYDVHCAYEEHLGSRIKVWKCTPNYEKKVTSDAAREFLEGKSFNTNWGTVLIKEKHLLEKMREQVEAHPELREARNALVLARHKLELERKSR